MGEYIYTYIYIYLFICIFVYLSRVLYMCVYIYYSFPSVCHPCRPVHALGPGLEHSIGASSWAEDEKTVWQWKCSPSSIIPQKNAMHRQTYLWHCRGRRWGCSCQWPFSRWEAATTCWGRRLSGSDCGQCQSRARRNCAQRQPGQQRWANTSRQLCIWTQVWWLPASQASFRWWNVRCRLGLVYPSKRKHDPNSAEQCSVKVDAEVFPLQIVAHGTLCGQKD